MKTLSRPIFISSKEPGGAIRHLSLAPFRLEVASGSIWGPEDSQNIPGASELVTTLQQCWITSELTVHEPHARINFDRFDNIAVTTQNIRGSAPLRGIPV